MIGSGNIRFMVQNQMLSHYLVILYKKHTKLDIKEKQWLTITIVTFITHTHTLITHTSVKVSTRLKCTYTIIIRACSVYCTYMYSCTCTYECHVYDYAHKSILIIYITFII